MGNGSWVLGAVAVLFSQACMSATPVPVVLKIHARILRYDASLVGRFYLPGTMELVQIGESGGILRSCSWCPRGSELQTEIDFILEQRSHLQTLRNESEKQSAHVTYEFSLEEHSCPYKVNHTTDECQIVYESSGKRVDRMGNCNLTDEEVKGAGIEKFLNVCSDLSKKWSSVYQKMQRAHSIDNVYALFWEDSSRDGNYTICTLRSPAPFVNIIELWGPGLKNVSGTTDEAEADTVTEVYNQTHPNTSCRIESPTGWSSVITRIREPDEKIFLGKRSTGPDEDVEAANIGAILVTIIGISVAIFSIACWVKRRDVINSMMEVHDWSRGRGRHRYTRVPW